MLRKIKTNLKGFIGSPPIEDLPKAAVLLAITAEEEPELIYTLRSNKVSSHKGEVAFPGGREEEGDLSLADTALREAEEEIGLDRNLVEILGSLDTTVSRYGISVTPYVGIIPPNPNLNESSSEIESYFRVPISYLANDIRHRNDKVTEGGETFFMPAYKYNEYIIWGLTAMITVNFLRLGLDKEIDLSIPS
ncbi:MAG: coenzyme A pyrophosphatase [Gammaproteobacteria bacterium]|jgi:8-oxo-dGTP pyrophosphatase MutT (NUDIX family)|nr:coenzyme A pyrophosphatase [Gammaproteobacteria bacterium]|tara:strand:- start:7712 stop:8287 length:576 start_codon:yes stop_codon:yes gene_type:complete